MTVSTAPRTIHDFAGFPRELYHPAPSARRALPATAQGVFAREPLGQDRPARGIAPGRNMEVIVLSHGSPPSASSGPELAGSERLVARQDEEEKPAQKERRDNSRLYLLGLLDGYCRDATALLLVGGGRNAQA